MPQAPIYCSVCGIPIKVTYEELTKVDDSFSFTIAKECGHTSRIARYFVERLRADYLVQQHLRKLLG